MWNQAFLVGFFFVLTKAQYAPGVPPRHDQDVKFHDPSEYRQPSQQHGQPQVQPAHHEEGHHEHSFGEKMDKEHLQQHVEEDYVDVGKLNERQLLLQTFRSADMDDSGKVDGLELLKFLVRMEEKHKNDTDAAEVNFEDWVVKVDTELTNMDKDNDGLISIDEYFLAVDEAKKNTKQEDL